MPTLIPSARNRRRSLFLVVLPAIAAVALIACQAAADPPRTITFQTLNASGVTGTFSFTALREKTAVEIVVNPGGNPNMPVHIHPGTCENLTPQPKFPLENVQNGSSKTVVPATIDELFAGGLAVNIHRSNDDLKTYTACVDIR